MALAELMQRFVFGQEEACELIEEQMEIYQAGLIPADHPAGVFMLYGPTGAGKTHVVESLATVLHQDHRKYLRIDCAEFQQAHEIAKLIGSPPGYLGHRETRALVGQSILNNLKSEYNALSLVCFDEIEKAHHAFHQLLLGVFDKARLRLGDNNDAYFTSTMIFMTSNLGANVVSQGIDKGSLASLDLSQNDDMRGLFKDAFSPEFLNRVDAFIPFKPLSREHLSKILDRHLEDLQGRIFTALEKDTFYLQLSPAARQYILQLADVPKWGARELGRVLQRKVTKQIARLIISREYFDPVSQTNKALEPDAKVLIDFKDSEIKLSCHRADLEELLRASIISTEWRKRNSQ